MSLPQSIRSLIPLVIGLVVGGVGATLFSESMPGAEGSPKERADKLELELKQTQSRLAALESPEAREKNSRGIFDRANKAKSTMQLRSIAERVRAGEPVSPEDIFRASKPWMRDIAPVFDLMRVRGQRKMFEGLSGEIARKYDLTPQQQEALKAWFASKSEEQAKQWTAMIESDSTRLVDFMRIAQDQRPDEGIDSFMETVLTGEKLAAFKTERLNDRAQRVQNQADAKVQRLNSIVRLSDAQRDQVFGIMARNSPDYDPAMVLEGTAGQINAAPTGDSQAAILSVLTPDQRVTYEAERIRRRDEAAKEMAEVGLAFPPEWDMLDEMDFR
jgi:hypothetical protein